MPTYPSLQQPKPGEHVDLTNIQYPVMEWIKAGAANEFEHMTYLNTINNTATHMTPRDGYPGTFPVTEEDIAGWKVDRPELPNIPVGVPKYIGNAVVSLYDNDRHLAMMNEAAPQKIGKMAAFGSSMATSFLDLKATLVAAVTGGIGGKAAPTIARMGLAKLGISEIAGSRAANIGTQIAQSGITLGAANIGFQAEREVQEFKAQDVLQQPHEYIQSLQNLGMAGATGFLLGAVGRGVGIGLFGRKVMRFEDGSFIDTAPDGKSGTYTPPDGDPFPQYAGKKWEAANQGGLFNRKEFQGMTPAQKTHVADNFKPWTPESDITMTEEAAGQMMNGQVVKVDTIMKQGIADAGESFRQAMRDGNIDLEALDSALDEAHGNIKLELAEAIKQSEALRDSTKALEATEKLPVTEESDLSQPGILKRAALAQFEESIMNQSPELVPERVRKHIELQKEIDRLNRKIEADKGKQLEGQPKKSAAEIEPNKKVIKRIEALEKRKPKLLKPKAELKQLRRELLKTAGTGEYGQGEPYQRLSELSRVWRSAKALKDNLDLHHNFEAKIAELAGHDFLINSMRDHINDTHEGATHADMQDYAEQLKSTGIPDGLNVAEEFQPSPEVDIDAYLQEYPPDELKSITEKLGDEAYNAEIERAAKKVSTIDVMKSMVKNMTDCLLKGAE